MNDEPFYTPGKKPPAARQPQPGEHVWTLVKNGGRMDCEFRDHGEIGVEVQLLRDRTLIYGQRCVNRLGAEQLAAIEREDLEREGWRHQ